MIALATTDDWTAAQVQITVGGTDVYTFGAAENDAATAMDALVSWANANGSFGGAVFAWSFDRQTAEEAMQLTLECDTSFSASFDAEAQTLLGFSSSYSSTTSAAGPNSAAGTIYGQRVGERGYLIASDRDADAGGDGAAHTMVAAWTPRRPTLETIGGWVLPARVHQVVKAAASPRTAQVYDGSSWRAFRLGEVTISREGSALFRASFVARAEV